MRGETYHFEIVSNESARGLTDFAVNNAFPVGNAVLTVENEDQLEDALSAAMSAGRSAVVDVRCDAEEKCFPMIPAGAAAIDIIEAPGGEVVPA